MICHCSNVLWIHFHLIIDEVYEHPEILLLSYVTRRINSLIYHSCHPSAYKKIVKIIRLIWQSLNFNQLKTVMRSLKFRIKIKYKKCSASENFLLHWLAIWYYCSAPNLYFLALIHDVSAGPHHHFSVTSKWGVMVVQWSDTAWPQLQEDIFPLGCRSPLSFSSTGTQQRSSIFILRLCFLFLRLL